MTATSDPVRTEGLARGLVERVLWLRAVLALAPAGFLLSAALARRWMDDDGFINLRVVKNLLHGYGPVFNVDERVEAVTSPLWVAVLAALGALGIRLEVAAVFAGIALTIVGLLLAQVAAARLYANGGAKPFERLRGVPLPIGAAIFAAIPAAWDYASAGLETGLGLAWLATTFHAMVRCVRGPTPSARGRTTWSSSRARAIASGVLVGSGPLIRPEFALYAVAPLGMLAWKAWQGVPGTGDGPRARGGRVTALLACALAAPVAYQIFRMGYYAAAAPNTALAKEAFLANFKQGRCYFSNFFDTYRLAFPLAAGSFVLAQRVRFAVVSRVRGCTLAVLWMPIVASLHAGYVVAIGGDYMHARMLIPALFAALLPIAMVPWNRPSRPLGWIGAGAAAAMVGAWAPVCAVSLRVGTENVCEIGDERGWYARLAKADHPVLLQEFRPHFFYEDTVKLQRRIADECASVPVAESADRDLACRAIYLDAEEQAKISPSCSSCPLDDGVDRRIGEVASFGAIGIAGYLMPSSMHLLDRHGLADPLVARAEIEQRGRPGHEKTLSPAWALARFARPDPGEDPAVTAARHALRCGELGSLVRAVTGPLTWGAFVDNFAHAFAYGRLRLPRDPFEAEARFCGTALLPGSATAGAGGTPFRWRCPSGSTVTGLRGTFKHGERAFGSIQALCGPVAGPSFGDKGGEPVEVDCDPGATTIGIHGWSDQLVRVAGLDCVYQGQETQTQARGTSSGSVFLLRCPEGGAVVGIRGRAGSLVDAIGIECAGP